MRAALWAGTINKASNSKLWMHHDSYRREASHSNNKTLGAGLQQCIKDNHQAIPVICTTLKTILSSAHITDRHGR